MTDEKKNPLLPQVCKVIKITDETPDVKTFRIQTPDGKRPFLPMPGQLGMISIPDVGEAMFSITAHDEDWIESSIKRVGMLTEALHDMSVGDPVGVRGPYGNGFPVDALKGKRILFITGGIALAPVRPLIRWCLQHREDYGHLDILYGSRSKADLVFKDDLFKNWVGLPDTGLYLTVDRGSDDWDGNVGFVPDYLEQCGFAPEGCKVILCGPPIMIKLTLPRLTKMGFAKDDIITSLEARMKCGIGKCGRCNIGNKFICKDGPVFTLSELDELPSE
ncbi:MAG: FAD/NAD(P)-binding protein [Oscillospiraceae bacterium]|nr:FAD/NAD(P)-binding protein [Oscillospiraceae bacterium]